MLQRLKHTESLGELNYIIQTLSPKLLISPKPRLSIKSLGNSMNFMAAWP